MHSTAVEAAARLIMNELKEKQPELLRNINIDKILPELRKKKTNSQPHTSNIDVNKVVATVTGHNVEDIVNLKDMSEFNLLINKNNFDKPALKLLFLILIMYTQFG